MRNLVIAVALSLLVSLCLASLAVGQEAPGTAPAIGAESTGGIAGFEFSGNTVFRAAALERALKPFQGKPVDAEQLQGIERAVATFYFSRGYHAVVKASEAGGKVAVQIAESRFGNLVEVGGDGAQEHRDPFYKRHFSYLKPGGVWREGALDRGVLLLRDRLGTGVSAIPVKGTAEGTIDYKLDVGRSTRGLDASISFDNFGSPQASQERLSENLAYANLTGRNDRIDLHVVHAWSPDDVLFGDLRYRIPLRADGLTVTAYASAGDFEVGRGLSVLGLNGSGQSFGGWVQYPLMTTRDQRLWAQVGLDVDNANFDMGTGGITLSEDRVRKVRLGATFDQIEQPGKSHNLGSVYLHQGLGGFLGGTTEAGTASRLEADNGFTKVTVEAARLQRLNARASIFVRLSGQVATQTLFVGEQMSIGGADSVRGYPQSEFLGDDGIQGSVEYRYNPLSPNRTPKPSDWLQGLQGVAFVDGGAVFLKDPQPGEDDTNSLVGTGIGVRARFAHDIALRADVGFGLGDEPSVGGRVQPYVKIEKGFRF